MDPEVVQDDAPSGTKAPPANSQEMIDEFIETTKQQEETVSEETARKILSRYAWNMNSALDAYFGGQQPSPARDDTPSEGNEDVAKSQSAASRPAPYAEGSSSRSQPRRQAQGNPVNVKTMGDLKNNKEAEVENHHDEGSRGDLFAGGEKSGLAVQDRGASDNAARRPMQNAQRAATRSEPFAAAGPPQPGHFSGSGQTLGGEGVPSRQVPSLHGNPIQRVGQHEPDQPRGRSTIHVWENGFSLNDGPLYRSDSDDAQHRMIFQFLKSWVEQQSGQDGNDGNTKDAPEELLHELKRILRLKHHEIAEADIHAHPNEKWRLVHPFAAAGRRLGSPVPGDGSSSIDSTIASQTSTRSATATATGAASVPSGVDESQPIVTIRIQLPNGTRVPARFNTVQTIGDVYGFVQQTSPETRSRNWVLATTFPNKEHIDHSAALGEMDEFKRGGTAVVKWV
ncbi:hypothetical protein RB593_006198 [Gaeumannomyces tritici]